MAKDPMYMNQKCYGFDLKKVAYKKAFDLSYVIRMYTLTSNKSAYFGTTNFFDKLCGNTLLKKQIIDGLSEAEIRKTWQKELSTYKAMRKKYLLYTDFE